METLRIRTEDLLFTKSNSGRPRASTTAVGESETPREGYESPTATTGCPLIWIHCWLHAESEDDDVTRAIVCFDRQPNVSLDGRDRRSGDARHLLFAYEASHT